MQKKNKHTCACKKTKAGRITVLLVLYYFSHYCLRRTRIPAKILGTNKVQTQFIFKSSNLNKLGCRTEAPNTMDMFIITKQLGWSFKLTIERPITNVHSLLT